MAVASVLAMMVRGQGRGVLEAARHGPGMEMPSVATTSPSYASFGKRKSLVSIFCSSPEMRETHVWAAWEAGSGWVYWTWKAENADEWSYQAGLNLGWIPQDPNQRIFPGICG